jgi:hypothetical protein
MTDPAPPPGEGVPGDPTVLWGGRSRADALAEWVVAQRPSFTDAALERSAAAAGYTHEEFVSAASVADARMAERAALVPIRSTATRVVLIAYAIVWALFAVPYLLLAGSTLGAGPVLQWILTVALGITLAISLIVVRTGRPDPSRVPRAMVILLALPIVMLVGVAGSCLPFVRT